MIMKNVKIVGVLLLAIVALVSCGESNKYTFSGVIGSTNATEAYLVLGENADTSVVEEGAFEFKGVIDEPTMATLIIEGRQTNIMLEASDITIEGAIDALLEAKIEGSLSQVPFDEFINSLEKNSTSQQAYVTYCKTFIEEHPDAYFTPYLIGNLSRMMRPEEVQSMMDALTPEVKATEVSKKIFEGLAKLSAVEEGGTAPDFTMNDVEGNPVTLSEVYSKSKYLLIDFWASWCAPCRAENPNVVANYEKYKDKGFAVLGVSLDKEQGAWEKAIEADGLNWLNVSDLKGWKNAAAGQYNVSSIPANVLVDSKGKIVARNLREAALGAKLSELLD